MPQLGWSLEKTKWDKIDEILKSNKWERISFNIDSKDSVKSNSGVYIFSISSKSLSKNDPINFFKTPIYIGYSINLRRRFIQHVKGNSDKNLRTQLKQFKRDVEFWFLMIENKTTLELKTLEQQLIDLYGGQLNKINSIKEVEKPLKAKIL